MALFPYPYFPRDLKKLKPHHQMKGIQLVSVVPWCQRGVFKARGQFLGRLPSVLTLHLGFSSSNRHHDSTEFSG